MVYTFAKKQIEYLKLSVKDLLNFEDKVDPEKYLKKLNSIFVDHKPNIFLENLLYKSNYSSIFSGHYNGFEKEIAIKIINPLIFNTTDPLELEDLENRFHDERVTQKRLCSKYEDSVVKIFKGGNFKNQRYLVMELMDSFQMRDFISASGYFSISDKVWLMTEMSKKLEKIHEDGTIHRDIKPENIMFKKGLEFEDFDFGNKLKIKKIKRNTALLKFGDLGASTWINSKSLDSYEGFIVGTINYMSPEQISKNIDLDTRTDILSLGHVFYEMTYGILAKELVCTNQVIKKFRVEEIVNSKNLVDFYPPMHKELHKIIEKMIRHDRNKRYQEISEVTNDLKDYYNTLDDWFNF